MQSDLTDITRANMRIDTLSLQLREAGQRATALREDNDDLQARVATLLAQKREPQCFDEVIHGVQEPAGGGE